MAHLLQPKKRKKPMPWHGDSEATTKMYKWRHRNEFSIHWNQYSEALQEPHGRWGKEFRRRFRLPVLMVKDLVDELDIAAIPGMKEKRAGAAYGRGPPTQPLLLKVLAALRMLGKGIDADSAAWEAQISETTLRKFRSKFIGWLATSKYTEWNAVPEGQKLRESVECYTKLGFLGAFASIDGVHVAWDRAKSSQRALYTGKEGYPTLVFDVAALHSRRIIHVTQPSPGKINDKTLSRYDEFIQALKAGKVGPYITYDLYTSASGDKVTKKGLFAIVDNGYHRCLRVVSVRTL
jgi:hypothetical protein